VRDTAGEPILLYGTLVRPSGGVTDLESDAFAISQTGTWTSPRTGRAYPLSWSIEIPGEQLFIELTPTLEDQELDTRATTGVIYWEGSMAVNAVRSQEPLGGEAYLEITRYSGPGEVR
jgi:predicted secreted hydrolase